MDTPAHIKALFFDRQKILDALDRATRKSLSKGGAFLRTRARSSLRKRKKSAAPGQPPSVHAGQLKDLLFFSFDPATRSTVVGPAKFGKGNVPQLLEFSGTASITRRGKTFTAHYRGNPTMKPALQAEIAAGTLPRAWADSVRSS